MIVVFGSIRHASLYTAHTPPNKGGDGELLEAAQGQDETKPFVNLAKQSRI